MEAGKASRYRLLSLLKDFERRDLIVKLTDITEALGIERQEAIDQIDILEDLGAVNTSRKIDGDIDLRIRGAGKLLLEQLEEELRRELKAEASPENEFEYEWDVFISHASEDKDPFVRQLAEELVKEYRVWYDEFNLELGDSLRQSIDAGLSKSRYGVVVLSRHFFAKQWPQWELDGLATREVGGRKVILPVWLDVTEQEVARASPLLASRLAARASDGVFGVLNHLRRVLGNPEPTVRATRAFSRLGARLDNTEVELTIGSSKSRPPDMELGLNARHVYGPPVVPLEMSVWSQLIGGSNKRQLPAYLEPGKATDARLTVLMRDSPVDVDAEGNALGWRLQDAPNDLWAIFRYRDLNGGEHEVARTFQLTIPDNQNLFQVGRPTGQMRQRD